MDLKLDLSSFSSGQEKVSENEIYDVIIIGGGPAALNAALYAARKHIKIALLTVDIGGQIIQSSSIENWLGDDEVKSGTLVNRFYQHIQHFNLPIEKEIKVVSLDCQKAIKTVTCSNNKTYQSKSVIVATGKNPRLLNIPGEKEFVGKGVAYCTTCDGPIFKDKKVVVVGGGNSGIEAAIDMLSYVKEVVIVQNVSILTADHVLTKQVLNNPRVSIVYDSICVRIEGDTQVEKLVIKNTTTDQEQSIVTDGVFVEIGLIPASGFVPQEVKNECGEIIINSDCSTSITGLYAAGDVTTVPFKQVIIAAGEGAKAALAVYNYIITL